MLFTQDYTFFGMFLHHPIFHITLFKSQFYDLATFGVLYVEISGIEESDMENIP